MTCPARRADPRCYERIIKSRGDSLFRIVTQLRERYPANDIDDLNYGLVASDMKNRFEQDRLPGITESIGRGDDLTDTWQEPEYREIVRRVVVANREYR